MFHVFGFFLGCVFNKHVLFAHYSPFFELARRCLISWHARAAPHRNEKTCDLGGGLQRVVRRAHVDIDYLMTCIHEKKTIHVFGSLA